MRGRSFTGPIILLGVGLLFLWSNLHPGFQVFDMLGQYWPFLLILWGLGRLIEVLLPRDNACCSSFSGGEVLLIVLICLAGSGMYAAGHAGFPWRSGMIHMMGTDFDYPVSAKASAGGAKLLVVDLPRGNLKISGMDTAEITVTGQKSIRAYKHEDSDRANGVTPVEIAVEGDHVIVRTNQDRALDVASIADDLEITVPRGLAVEARGRRNDYEVADVAGNVELASDRGDARLARIGGSVRLVLTRSDTLRAEDVKGNVDINGQGSGLELENIGGQVARFQKPGQASAVRRRAQYRIARTGRAGTHHHGSEPVRRPGLDRSGAVGSPIARYQDRRLYPIARTRGDAWRRGD